MCMVDISLDGSGNVLPEKNDKIALIDADTVVFAAIVSTEYYEELLARELYTDEEWDLVISDPGYYEPEHRLYGIDLPKAFEHAMNKINVILKKTGCADFELHFTAGRESFRYTKVNKTYKENRLIDSQGNKSRTPMGLYELKQLFCSTYPGKAQMWYACEADDVVWWLGNNYPDKYIVCAVDKDILGAMRYKAFNYFARNGYIHPRSGKQIEPIDMKFVDVPKDPDIYWYKQCLTGDKGDGIIGIAGIGPKKAEKILQGCNTDKERWDAVVNAYEVNGRDMVDALLNMRMVRLDQYNPETNVLNLWDPRDLED